MVENTASVKTVEGYRIVRTIGRGANSVVKEVTKNEITFAMKIMKLTNVRENKKVQEVMKKEIEILASHNIAGLPAIYDYNLNAQYSETDAKG